MILGVEYKHHHIWRWVAMKDQIQGHWDFEALNLVKEPSLALGYC